MEPLHYNAVVSSLFHPIPEAKNAYDAWQMPGDPLPYIVFSFLEGSFLKPAVNSGHAAELLGRIFQFFEHMAASSDIEVVNLLYVGLFEAWVADAMTLERALKYMGPETKALAREAAHRLRCGHNLPSE